MSRPDRRAFAGAMIPALLGLALYAQAEPPPPAPPAAPSPTEQAIAYRKAVFTVLAGNFGPIGAVLQGHAPFDAKTQRQADRVASLAQLVPDAFPAGSGEGNTRVRPEAWSNPEGLSKASRDLIDATAALAAQLHQDNRDTPEFRSAVQRVGQACKSCHDDFRKK